MNTGRSKTMMKTAGYSLALLLLGSASISFAAPRDVARRIHDRLVGTPPTDTVLTTMEGQVAGGNSRAAALTAINQAGNTNFYNTTLRNFFATYTSESQSIYVDLNDATATMVGMVRDDIPFNEVLFGNHMYVGTGVNAAYDPANNDHYLEIQNQGMDLKATLTRIVQSALHPDLDTTTVAGVITSRAFAEAYFSAGTNRRMTRFTFMNFLCRDMEDVLDLTRTPDRVRQDLSRAPGDDSAIYLSSCVGCHAGMDPLSGAFAYYEWDAQAEQLVYDNSQPQGKNLINANSFPLGYVTVDDSWENRWRRGSNSVMGWAQGLPGAGNGAQSWGREVAGSRAFAECQAKKVFTAVCLHEPANGSDRTFVDQAATTFQSGYNMKNLFADTAAYCASGLMGL